MSITERATVIKARGVLVSFGGVTALDHVDMEVAQGELFVLCGPNGSGKTTMLNALSGFAPVKDGDVMLGDTSVLGKGPHQRARLGLGRTFQNPHVVPHARVHDLLSFGLHQQDSRSWAKAIFRPLHTQKQTLATRARFREMLEHVGLPSSLLDTELLSLSLGQLKMVDIARALLAEPRVLLMDEPTSGLNPAEIDRLREIVLALRADGRTAVLVEHNVQFVLDLADRVAVLSRGRMLAIGAPRETLRRPEVVEAYLGPKATVREDSGLVSELDGGSAG
jgi:ABC-type branched-subunit amino acid transport system ATPase component